MINDLLEKRYACKLFTKEKVKEEDLERMKESIRLSPSSFNLQPWKIKIVDNQDTLKELQKFSWNQKQVGTASHLFVFCAFENLEKRKKDLLELLRGKIESEKIDLMKERLEEYLDGFSLKNQSLLSEREVFIAMENLLLCVEDLGYSACPIGGFEADKYKEILGIQNNLNPIILVAVGIAKDSQRPKFRFKDKDIFF